jgi:hypothetical protein
MMPKDKDKQMNQIIETLEGCKAIMVTIVNEMEKAKREIYSKLHRDLDLRGRYDMKEEELFNKIEEVRKEIHATIAKMDNAISQWAIEGMDKPKKKKEESEEDRLKPIICNVLDMMDKHGDNGNIDLDTLTFLAVKKGIKKEDFEAALNKLIKDGMLFELEKGIISRPS